jgi:hypothetical protein
MTSHLSESRVAAAIFSLMSLSIAFTVARLLARRKLRAFGVDDVLIICAVIFVIPCATLEFYKCHYNLRILDDMSHHGGKLNIKTQGVNLNHALRMSYVANGFYLFVLALVKCSILWFYLRLGPQNHRWVLYVLAGTLVANSTVHFIFKFVEIIPLKALWYIYLKKIPYKSHFSGEKLDIANSSYQAAIDVIILILPIPVLWKLKMPMLKKATLLVVYLFGFISFSATIVRLYQTIAFDKIKVISVALEYNLVYTIWTQVEIHSAIICANIPAIAAAVRLFPWRRLASKVSTSKLVGSTGKSGASRDASGPQASEGKSAGSRYLPHARSADSDVFILQSTDIYVDVERKGSQESEPF